MLYMFFSFVLILLCLLVVLFNKAFSKLYFRITIFLTVLWILLSVFYYYIDRMTSNGIDESVVYHLIYGLKGADYKAFRYVFIEAGLIIFLVFSGISLICYLERFITTEKRCLSKKILPFSVLFLVSSFVIHPAFNNFKDLKTFILTSYNTFTSSHFIHSYGKTVQPKKNIVFFWLESLEYGFLNDRIYPGLMPRIHALKNKSYAFTDIVSPAGTTWSMAGITAQSCGVPLLAFSEKHELLPFSRLGGRFALYNDFQNKSFLPLANCMQDILTQSGYYVHYTSGADLDFAGLKKFMESHGFASFTGYHALQAAYPDLEESGWGVRDSEVLKIATKHYKDLSVKHKPFALFVETADTHVPAIEPDKYCRNHLYPLYAKTISDKVNTLHSIYCLDQGIGEFIDTIMPDIEAGKTMVVLVSDHRSPSGLVAPVNPDNDQNMKALTGKNTFIILDKDLGGGLNDSKASVLDVGATVLGLLDEEIKGIGYGRNLFKEKSLREKQDNLDQFLRSEIPFISSLWNWPQAGEQIEFTESHVLVNNQAMSLPVIMLLDDKGYIRNFLFKNLDKDISNALFEELRDKKLDYYLSLDQCSENREFYKEINKKSVEKKYCVLYGNRENGVKLLQADNFETLMIKHEEMKKADLSFYTNSWKACKSSVIYQGKVVGDCAVELKSKEKKQHMLTLYLPEQPAGDYSVKLTYSSPLKPEKTVANWLIYIRGATEALLAEGSLNGSNGQTKTVTEKFSILPEQTGKSSYPSHVGQEFELAVFVPPESDLKVETIEITRLK